MIYKNKRAVDAGTTYDYKKARINALTRYRIAGTLPEEIFDHLLRLATLIFHSPGAIIAFEGEDKIHHKAITGMGSAENCACYEKVIAETIDADTEIYITNLSQTSRPESDSTYTFYAGTPIFTHDGFPIGCLCLFDYKNHKLTAENISVLKILAAEVMNAVEERLRNLQEIERDLWFSKTSHEGMWEWDIQQNKIWWNPGFCMLFDYPPVNSGHYDLDFWCSRFENIAFDEIKHAIQSFDLNGEYLFKKADDKLTHVLIRSVVIRDEFGEAIKVIGSILDTSERFISEEINREANIEMLRNKDEFISITSHEIRTPITIIKSYSQLIEREAKRDVYQNTNFSLYAERIQKQSEKLLKLAENLLDISCIDNGKMIISPETFDFIKLLEQTIDELDAENGTHIIEKTGHSSLNVYADKFRIGQVLTNLITNAIKYSPGAEKIIIGCDKNEKSNAATISIRDFGIGIAKEDQVKLFQKFQRILHLYDVGVPGTGLGLSIAMEIMKQHGSTITVNSEPGKGSVFSFDLLLSPVFNSQARNL